LLLALLLLVTGCSSATPQPKMFILKGDLHCHSSFSHDSDVPYAQVIADSVTAGYDFISLTEHNTNRHLREDYSTPELLVVRGYEATTTAGHVNVFGLSSVPMKSAVYSADEFNQYLAPLAEQGAFLQLDHPNAELYFSRFGYDVQTHGIEILNGVFRDDDRQTLQDYQQLLLDGRKVIATGGTDAHRNHTKRGAYNCVLVTERTEQAILQGLAAGRNYVTVEVEGPVISMQCGDAVMGGTVVRQSKQTVEIKIEQLKPGMIVRLYTDKGMAIEQSADSSYTIKLPTDDIAFVRAEVWFANDTIAAYSNPIYIGD